MVNKEKDPSQKLSECLFSQYSFTVAGVMGATGYSFYKRPMKNGIGVMLVAGGVGTMADLAYGWSTKCRPFVLEWQKQYQQQEEQERNESSENFNNGDEESK